VKIDGAACVESHRVSKASKQPPLSQQLVTSRKHHRSTPSALSFLLFSFRISPGCPPTPCSTETRTRIERDVTASRAQNLGRRRTYAHANQSVSPLTYPHSSHKHHVTLPASLPRPVPNRSGRICASMPRTEAVPGALGAWCASAASRHCIRRLPLPSLTCLPRHITSTRPPIRSPAPCVASIEPTTRGVCCWGRRSTAVEPQGKPSQRADLPHLLAHCRRAGEINGAMARTVVLSWSGA